MPYPNERILTVSQLNSVVKAIIDGEPLLSGLTVIGEISGFKRYGSGHLYFTLKDSASALSCVMFAGNAVGLRFQPQDGTKVRVKGAPTVYERDGRYQFMVRSMEEDGKGNLWEAFEALKRKLEAEGLFREEYKKPLPRFPGRIGVVTSKDGAVFRDILNVTGRRFPQAEILLCPSAVQGMDAARQLTIALQTLDAMGACDVIIIGRGGGSMEDLFCFNDERLARAIFAAKTPIISAVGHETDFTICDFVADRRAPTPSAAAELAVPDRYKLMEGLDLVEARMRGCVLNALEEHRKNLKRFADSQVMTDKTASVHIRMQILDNIEERLQIAAKRQLESKQESFEALSLRLQPASERTAERKRAILAAMAGKMTALNPMAILSRGYSALFDGEGRVVKTIGVLKPDQKLTLKLVDGEATARVEEVRSNENS